MRPYFIREDKVKDANMRRPDDPEYDPTTLYIPQNEWQNFSKSIY